MIKQSELIITRIFENKILYFSKISSTLKCYSQCFQLSTEIARKQHQSRFQTFIIDLQGKYSFSSYLEVGIHPGAQHATKTVIHVLPFAGPAVNIDILRTKAYPLIGYWYIILL